MADNTVAGVAAIVAIVLIAALYFATQGGSEPENMAGQAYTAPADDAPACNPGRFCEGSKLIIIRDDCSVAEAYCKSGCNREATVCN